MTSRPERLSDRLLAWAAPLTVKLSSRRRQRVVKIYALVIAAAIGLAVVDLTVHFGHEGLTDSDWGMLSLLLGVAAAGLWLRAWLLPRDRAGWALLAAGLSLGALGWLAWGALYSGVPNPPSPNVADVLWLPFFPAVYIGLGLILGSESLGVRRDMWLDGMVAACAIGAFADQFALMPLLTRVGGSTEAQKTLATNFAYPVFDLVLITFVAIGFWVSEGRLSRRFLLFGVAGAALLMSDILLLIGQTAGDAQPDAIMLAPCMLATIPIAIAAWRPERRFVVMHQNELRMLAAPIGFTLGSAGLLIVGGMYGLPRAVVGLAGGSVALGVLRFALTLRDINMQAKAQPASPLDRLTGLASWDGFQSAGSRMLDARSSAALLLMDIDHFKELNDTLGHKAGDELLVEVARRLESVQDPGELLARLGGDEFAVLTAHADPDAVAARYRSVLESSFVSQGIQVHIEASAGISVFPDNGVSLLDLLQRADVAMFAAKSGRLGHQAYDAATDTHSVERLSLLGDLHDAISADELLLHYQPKVSIADGSLVGVEALVRWAHPTRGLLGPAMFVPAIEQTTMTGPLTAKVLELALAQTRLWMDEGLYIPVSVNASAANLLDHTFPQSVARLLAHHRVDPSMLVLEITETAVMADPLRATDTLRRLRALGVEASLDDFGTGYSSLLHLKQLAVSELKIDRSFVSNMLTSSSDGEIVRSTIELAGRLDMLVVAEGVETAEVLAQLAAYHCDVAQGFLLAPPLTPAELELWLAERRGQLAS
jgi:diguanylate cyclase (GGDEF)-like protein